jgi:hypothetical protein
VLLLASGVVIVSLLTVPLVRDYMYIAEFEKASNMRAFIAAEIEEKIGHGPPRDQAEEELVRRYIESQKRLIDCAKDLGRVRSDRAARQLLAEMRKVPHSVYWEFHREGIAALERIGKPAVPAIVDELEWHFAEDEGVGQSSASCRSIPFHQRLMRVVGKVGPDAALAIGPVMWHARDTASQAMEHANEALDPIPEVAILARIANPAAPVLSELIKDNEPDVLRVEAAVRLWGAGEPKRADAVLQELTQSASAGVRRRARQALGLIEASSETPSGKQ